MKSGLKISKKEERYGKTAFPFFDENIHSIDDLYELSPEMERFFNKDIITRISEVHGPISRIGLLETIKYIFFLYDENTKLVDEFPDDLMLRKQMAAKDAGFKQHGKGDWPEYIKDIFNLKDKIVVKLVIDFIQVQKSSVWREWRVSEEELAQMYELRMGSLNSGSVNIKQRAEVSSLCDTLIEKIDKLKRKFYQGNTDLQTATENQIIPVRPENVFKVLGIDESIYTYRQAQDVPQAKKLG